jgi:hypothetical protein
MGGEGGDGAAWGASWGIEGATWGLGLGGGGEGGRGGRVPLPGLKGLCRAAVGF